MPLWTRTTRTRVAIGVIGLLTAGFGGTAYAQKTPVDLNAMSLEELMSVVVTSAGKKDQRLGDAAAAVYVITAADIQRSHGLTIVDLLRQVPGILVARENTGEWSISIRGFNDKHANKLLVLMDGRSLYSPLYTGIEWDVQDTLIEDVDRIEVVRGPGASLWGANAVNGVINIITKSAKDTQGAAVTYHAGLTDKSTIAARWGGSFGTNAHFSVFSKYFTRGSMALADGTTPSGGWTGMRYGGQLDWTPTPRDQVRISSQLFRSSLNETDDEITSFLPPFESTVEEHDRTTAGFVLGRWSRTQSDRAELNVQFFYDRIRQYDGLGNDKDEAIETLDLEAQQRWRGGRHDVVFGGGLRVVRDHVDAAFDSWFTPERHTALTQNLFVQDEVGIAAVRLTLGSKIEWNEYTGAEVQPTARLLWTLSPAHTVWGSVSRAVRVPSRTEMHQQSVESIELDDDDQLRYELLSGTPTLQPEKLTSSEIGYRFAAAKGISVDTTAFHNVYDDLYTLEVGAAVATTFPAEGLQTPLFRDNLGYARVQGIEVVGTWSANDSLRVIGSYTHLRMQAFRRDESTDENIGSLPDHNARNLFYLRADLHAAFGVDLSPELRFVGKIVGQEVPAYLDANVHVSRAVGVHWRLGVSFDNLLYGDRSEWDGEGGFVLPRSVRAKLEWRF
jgi:iron complex outermembrane recepter protein